MCICELWLDVLSSMFWTDLYRAAWDVLSSSIKTELRNPAAPDSTTSSLVPSILKVFATAFEPASPLADAAHALTTEIIESVIEEVKGIAVSASTDASDGRVQSLTRILDVFGGAVFGDAVRAKVRLPCFLFVFAGC